MPLCANEFPWSRNLLKGASSRVLIDGGRNNKSRSLVRDALRHTHAYWFTPEDAWLRASSSGDVCTRLSNIFAFARARQAFTRAGACVVLDALDEIFPAAAAATTAAAAAQEQEQQQLLQGDLLVEDGHELFLTLLIELDAAIAMTGLDDLRVICICNNAELLHPQLAARFPRREAMRKFRSPNTIPEWEDFFLDRVTDSSGDSGSDQDTALAIAACQNNLSLQQIVACLSEDGAVLHASAFAQLIANQTLFPDTSKVPFTFLPHSGNDNNNGSGDPFDTVGGQAEAKQTLIEALEWPLTRKREMARLGITRGIRGVLLCGAPGAGKTLLARAASQRFSYNFLSVSVSDLIRGNVGQSEQRVSHLFALARTCKPCILFFDECHALFAARQNLGPSGQKVLSQFLVEMDQVEPGIVLLAATNEQRMVDSALLGRFDRVVELHGLRTMDDYLQVLRAATTQNAVFSKLNLRLVAQILLDHCEDDAAARFTTGASIVQLLFRAQLECEQRSNGDAFVTEQDVAIALLDEEK